MPDSQGVAFAVRYSLKAINEVFTLYDTALGWLRPGLGALFLVLT